MSLAKLKLISRMRSQYPSANSRRSEEEKDYEAYLQTLSSEELEALYENDLAEYRKSPEGIALDKRLAGMSIEELMLEMNEMLKAS